MRGNVNLNGSGLILNNVTFVADGTIMLNGGNSGPATPAAANGVLFWSASSSASAISINGAKGRWQGTICAPNGAVTFNGASQCVQNGSILAERINVNGSGWEIFPSPDLVTGPRVSLIR